MDRFAGALAGRYACGIYITTAGFTRTALAKAASIPHITPVDGDQVAALLLGQGVGVLSPARAGSAFSCLCAPICMVQLLEGDGPMSYGDIVAEVQRLPLHTQLRLLEELVRAVQKQVITQPAPARVLPMSALPGVLKPESGVVPSAEEIRQMIAGDLINKHA